MPGGGGFMVPGGRVAADSFHTMLPAGSAVLTHSGQALMMAGAPLDAAVAAQAPHFASGGYVRPFAPYSEGKSGHPGKKLKPAQIAGINKAAGFRGPGLVTSIAVSMHESDGGYPKAWNARAKSSLMSLRTFCACR